MIRRRFLQGLAAGLVLGFAGAVPGLGGAPVNPERPATVWVPSIDDLGRALSNSFSDAYFRSTTSGNAIQALRQSL